VPAAPAGATGTTIAAVHSAARATGTARSSGLAGTRVSARTAIAGRSELEFI
jgi:hypothetical protein